MFLVGVVLGLMFVVVYVVVIFLMGWFIFKYVGGCLVDEMEWMFFFEIVDKIVFMVLLIVVVFGGIYMGWLILVEVGVIGVLFGLVIVVFW